MTAPKKTFIVRVELDVCEPIKPNLSYEIARHLEHIKGVNVQSVRRVEKA